eukprot:sb/3469456/
MLRRTENAALNKACEGLKSELAQLREDLDDKTSSYNKTMDELGATNNAKAGLEKKTKDLQEALSSSKAQCDSLGSVNSELTVQLSGVQGEKERLVGERTKLRDQLGQLSQDLDDKTSSYNKTMDELGATNNAKAGLEKKTKDLQEALSSSKAQCDSLGSVNSELTVQLSGVQGEKESSFCCCFDSKITRSIEQLRVAPPCIPTQFCPVWLVFLTLYVYFGTCHCQRQFE